MARPYIFQELAKLGRAEGMTPQASRAANKWFRAAARNVASVNTNRLIEGTPSRLQSRLTAGDIGHMFMFYYDAKHKDTLPYWDQFPLILPFHIGVDHFKGFNLHYISPYRRAQVMDALYKISEKEGDMTRRLNVSYSILNQFSKLSPLRPCVKMYLKSNLKSRLMWVRPEEWDMAIMMPTARFVGASPMKVQRDSARRF